MMYPLETPPNNSTEERLDEILTWIKTHEDRRFTELQLRQKFIAKYSDSLDRLMSYLVNDGLITAPFHARIITETGKPAIKTYSYSLTPKGEFSEGYVKQKETTQRVENKKQSIPLLTFKDIFIESMDYHKCLEPLCTMKKPLLKINSDKSYTFICGKAAICRYFYQDLKDKSLKEKVRQEDISNVLFHSIKEFGPKPKRNSYNNETFQYRDLKKHISHKY